MNCYKVYKSTQIFYSQNNAVADEQQNHLLNLLKTYWLDSLEILKQATTELKELKLQQKIINRDALAKLLKDMTLFHKERRGLGEIVLEDTISNYPINAKHNPFYNQSFN